MKVTKILIPLTVSATLAISIALSGCTNSVNASGNSMDSESSYLTEASIDSMPAEELSQAETDGLVYMREEEKLARDVYLSLYAVWGQRIFTNISGAEQMHTDAIKILLDKYELTDPVQSDSTGSFTNTDLKALFTSLTTQGSVSLIEALKTGALIEEIDIKDLVTELEENVDNEDITFVYENLYRGSRNHLRAFVRNLSRQGVTYEPVVLDPTDYQKIIDSDWERGR